MFACVFNQCCSHLDWLKKASKTRLLLCKKYQSCFCHCFYMYLDLAGLRNETETANNMHVVSPLLARHTHIINHVFRVHKYTCTNIQVGVTAKLQRENSNAQQTNEGSNIQSFFPALICMTSNNTYIHVLHVY